MKLVAEMDEGPVYAQIKLDLSGTESKQQLADTAAKIGAGLLLEKLPAILDGTLAPTPQSETGAIVTQKITKLDGIFDWKKPAATLEKEVLAYSGWPKSRARIFDNDVIITKVREAKDKSDGDLVLPAAGSWLEVQELTAPSGRTMSGADFLRGYAKENAQ